MTKKGKTIIAVVIGIIFLAIILLIGSFFTYKIYNSNKNVKKGLELIDNKQYDESIIYLDNAINGKINTKEAKNIKIILGNYLSAKELFDVGQFDDADIVIKDIDSSYSNYASIKEDVDNLKKQIEDAKIEEKAKEMQSQQPVPEKTIIVQQPKVVQQISQRQRYLNYLGSIEAGLSDLDYLYDGKDSNLKKAEHEKFRRWDNALNEIYRVIQAQLSKSEANKLTQEELKWIEYKENTSKQEGLQFEGGTLQPIQEVMTSIRITKQRCYELVNKYM